MTSTKTLNLCLFYLLLLAGCSSQIQEEIPTPTPATTPVGMAARAGYTPAPPSACLVQELETITAFRPQGDLIAWSPDGDSLAFITPQENTRVALGSLALAAAPDFAEVQVLNDNVVGDLTWAPGGDGLAYLALITSTGQYTIAVSQLDGSDALDLFPADKSKTNDWSSLKAIVEWPSNNSIKALVSCGSSCQTEIEVNPWTGTQGESTPTTMKLDEALAVWTGIPAELPDGVTEQEDYSAFAKSPDGQWIAYLDARARLWILEASGSTLFQIYLGGFAVQEVKWSPDSQLLAVRTDYQVLIYRLGCQESISYLIPLSTWNLPVPRTISTFRKNLLISFS